MANRGAAAKAKPPKKKTVKKTRTVRSMRKKGKRTDSGPSANARLILTYAHDSAAAFEDAFRTVRASNRA